jgi:N6-adenosine-specific RNA methylase IME4
MPADGGNVKDAPLKYRAILADPPWKFATYSTKGMGRSAEAHYDCMTLSDIAEMPVREWAAEDSVLFLWTTDPLLQQALSIVSAWGFTYKTIGFVWAKSRKDHTSVSDQDHPIGTGYWTRCLSGNTSVIITMGNELQIVPLSYLYGKDLNKIRIWSHAGWKKLYGVIKNAGTEVAEIKTRIGSSICSWDHRWAYKRRRGHHPFRQHVVEYGTLSEIERLRNAYQPRDFSINLVFSTTPIERPSPIVEFGGFSLTSDIGWLIGLFCAEGNCSTERPRCVRFSLASSETNIANEIKRIVSSLHVMNERYFNTKVEAHSHEVNGKNGLAVYFSSGEIKQLISSFILGNGAHNKRLNLDLLLQTSVAFRKAVLKGMLDGDGTKEISERSYEGFRCLGLCNKNLIGDYRILCHGLGIMTSMHCPAPQPAGNGTMSQIFVMRFVSPRNKSLNLDDVKLMPVEIKHVKRSAILQTTYDISVEGESFVADWMVSHNSNPELCLLATRGKPKRLSKSVRELIVAPRREHSRKPDEIYSRIEALCDGPYLEMFSRFPRSGWDCVGIEDGIRPRRWKSNSYPGRPA